MKKGNKKLVFIGITLLVIVFLGYGILFALSSYLSSRSFINSITGSLYKQFLCNVEIGSIEFGFPPSITLHNVAITTKQGQKIIIIIKGKKLKITPNIGRVISSIDEIKTFFLPHTTPQKNSAKEPSTCQVMQSVLKTPFLDALKRVALIEGELVLLVDNEEQVRVTDVVVDCGIVAGKKIILDGSVSAKSARVSGMWKTGRVRGSVRLDNEELKVSDVVIPAYDGTISLNGSVDLVNEILNPTTLNVAALECGKAYADMKVHPGSMSGVASAHVVLGPCELTPGSFKGKGSLSIKDVAIQNLPLQKSIFVALILPEMSKISFSVIKSDIEITSEKIFNTKTVGTGEPISFTTKGWVSIPGPLSQQARCSFSPSFSGRMPSFVRNTLDPSSDGGRSFAVAVSGSFYEPEVKLDRALINRAVDNAMQEVFIGLKKYFRK